MIINDDSIFFKWNCNLLLVVCCDWLIFMLLLCSRLEKNLFFLSFSEAPWTLKGTTIHKTS